MNRKKLKRTTLVTVIALFLSAASFIRFAYAGAPTDLIRTTTEQAQKIIEDSNLNDGEKRNRLRKIISHALDFQEITRRALGRHYSKLNEAERQEFLYAFTDFLEFVYFRLHNLDTAKGATFLYLREDIQTNTAGEIQRAVVKTKLILKSRKEVQISYILHWVGNGWKVYDIIVEGMSLVGNYRSQFNEIITTRSLKELLKQLKEKNLELRK